MEKHYSDKLKNLKDWFNLIHDAEPNGKISLKTSLYLHKIMSNSTTGNYIIFDNAGGCVYDIWKVDSEEKIESFIESIGEHLVYGYIKKGKKFLMDHQLTNPHWDIQRYLRVLKAKELKAKFIGKKVKISNDFHMASFRDFENKDIEVLDIDQDQMCTISINGEKYKNTIALRSGWNIELVSEPDTNKIKNKEKV